MAHPCISDVPQGGGSQDGVWPQRALSRTFFPHSTEGAGEEKVPALHTASATSYWNL